MSIVSIENATTTFLLKQYFQSSEKLQTETPDLR